MNPGNLAGGLFALMLILWFIVWLMNQRSSHLANLGAANPPPAQTAAQPSAPSPNDLAARPSAPASMLKIQLWVKTKQGTISVTADHGLQTTVAQIRAKVAAAAQIDPEACRLIFAGKELEDSRSLAEYNCQDASELNLILRDLDQEAAAATAALRARMAGKKLSSFRVSKKIGGKDIARVGGGSQSISQSGVCSYVYLAQLRGGDGMEFAIKVRRARSCTAERDK